MATLWSAIVLNHEAVSEREYIYVPAMFLVVSGAEPCNGPWDDNLGRRLACLPTPASLFPSNVRKQKGTFVLCWQLEVSSAQVWLSHLSLPRNHTI